MYPVPGFRPWRECKRGDLDHQAVCSLFVLDGIRHLLRKNRFRIATTFPATSGKGFGHSFLGHACLGVRYRLGS